jgi:hypothetical protein
MRQLRAVNKSSLAMFTKKQRLRPLKALAIKIWLTGHLLSSAVTSDIGESAPPFLTTVAAEVGVAETTFFAWWAEAGIEARRLWGAGRDGDSGGLCRHNNETIWAHLLQTKRSLLRTSSPVVPLSQSAVQTVHSNKFKLHEHPNAMN